MRKRLPKNADPEMVEWFAPYTYSEARRKLSRYVAPTLAKERKRRGIRKDEAVRLHRLGRGALALWEDETCESLPPLHTTRSLLLTYRASFQTIRDTVALYNVFIVAHGSL